MSIPKKPKSVKLVVSIIYADESMCEKGISLLKERFGNIDILERLNFHFTKYYQKEMGENLRRCFFSFERLIKRHELAEIKLFTNEIEKSLAKENGQRTINIDPGYVCDSQLVLATAKDFSHRIYLGKGIFADLTLIFKHKHFQSMPWTYPDYQSEELQDLLLRMRETFLQNAVSD